ncbi:hypothetical protein E3U43_003884 [Larimichthys crocea]|uniref:Uncharacterized protein n=1 Tax=Larimichthys crocea TaxID=215358 RepID=A0ACD3RK23_LARCR|nr:hypothetical protein E3U43_003884 [Larimichthys crocea]
MLTQLCLVLVLSASVCPESQVRETETWMPMKTTQTAAAATHHDHVESSGGGPNHSDFGFTDDEDDEDYDSYDHEDDDEEQDDFSGSGDRATTVSPGRQTETSAQPDVNDNKIPEVERPARPTIDEVDIVREQQRGPAAEERARRGAAVQRPHVPRQRRQHLQQDGGPGSSDRGRRRRPDVCRPPHPPPHLPHEEEGRGQLRSGEEAHLQESPHHRDLCVDRRLLHLPPPSPHSQTHTSPLKTQSVPRLHHTSSSSSPSFSGVTL